MEYKFIMKSSKVKEREEMIKAIISFLIVGCLFILASYLFRNYETNIEGLVGVKSMIGMFFFFIMFILSIVFVPVSAMPLIPIGAKVWGVYVTTILSVVGWTIGAVIAFKIARKFGRPYVLKIISLKRVEKIEKLIPEKHIFLTILFFRSVTPFDGLSYILGLVTRIRFRTFFWATFFGLIPFSFTMAFLGSLPTIYSIIGLVLAGLFCLLGILGMKRMYEKSNQKILK